MEHPPAISLEEMIAATQDWWRDAGVDYAFEDEVQGWLKAPAEAQTARNAQAAKVQADAEPEIEQKLGGPEADWPHKLDAFVPFFQQAARIDGAGSRPSPPPRGNAGAELMVIVPMPEEGDTDRLLSGMQGALLHGFLKAAGLAEERVYIVPALPHFLPMPDFDALAKQGLGELLLHHIALARPERVLVLGSRLPALLGHDPAHPPSRFTQISAKSQAMPAFACHGPEQLLLNARLRARLWHGWLDWMKA